MSNTLPYRSFGCELWLECPQCGSRDCVEVEHDGATGQSCVIGGDGEWCDDCQTAREGIR